MVEVLTPPGEADEVGVLIRVGVPILMIQGMLCPIRRRGAQAGLRAPLVLRAAEAR
jgi:hypothetical protein